MSRSKYHVESAWRYLVNLVAIPVGCHVYVLKCGISTSTESIYIFESKKDVSQLHLLITFDSSVSGIRQIKS